MSEQNQMNWVDINARLNIAGALIVIAILLLALSLKVVDS